MMPTVEDKRSLTGSLPPPTIIPTQQSQTITVTVVEPAPEPSPTPAPTTSGGIKIRGTVDPETGKVVPQLVEKIEAEEKVLAAEQKLIQLESEAKKSPEKYEEYKQYYTQVYEPAYAEYEKKYKAAEEWLQQRYSQPAQPQPQPLPLKVSPTPSAVDVTKAVEEYRERIKRGEMWQIEREWGMKQIKSDIMAFARKYPEPFRGEIAKFEPIDVKMPAEHIEPRITTMGELAESERRTAAEINRYLLEGSRLPYKVEKAVPVVGSLVAEPLEWGWTLAEKITPGRHPAPIEYGGQFYIPERFQITPVKEVPVAEPPVERTIGSTVWSAVAISAAVKVGTGVAAGAKAGISRAITVAAPKVSPAVQAEWATWRMTASMKLAALREAVSAPFARLSDLVSPPSKSKVAQLTAVSERRAVIISGEKALQRYQVTAFYTPAKKVVAEKGLQPGSYLQFGEGKIPGRTVQLPSQTQITTWQKLIAVGEKRGAMIAGEKMGELRVFAVGTGKETIAVKELSLPETKFAFWRTAWVSRHMGVSYKADVLVVSSVAEKRPMVELIIGKPSPRAAPFTVQATKTGTIAVQIPKMAAVSAPSVETGKMVGGVVGALLAKPREKTELKSPAVISKTQQKITIAPKLEPMIAIRQRVEPSRKVSHVVIPRQIGITKVGPAVTTKVSQILKTGVQPAPKAGLLAKVAVAPTVPPRPPTPLPAKLPIFFSPVPTKASTPKGRKHAGLAPFWIRGVRKHKYRDIVREMFKKRRW